MTLPIRLSKEGANEMPYPAANQRAQISPPLKWAGGKRWLVQYLKPIWERHRHRRLVEPLCGGLAVTLGLLPKRGLLNDINPHPVNFYIWLSRGLEVTVPMENTATCFYAYRERFNDLVRTNQWSSKEAAQLFYYLNRTAYNGLCRFNSRGEYNAPFGKYKRIHYAKDFHRYREVLASWEFTSGDFQIVDVQPDDFIYADPPYDVEFTQYAKEGFGWLDQVRLAKWLADHQGPVALSNQATDRIVQLYGDLGFELRFFNAPRRISCDGNRTPAREVLALKGV